MCNILFYFLNVIFIIKRLYLHFISFPVPAACIPSFLVFISSSAAGAACAGVLLFYPPCTAEPTTRRGSEPLGVWRASGDCLHTMEKVGVA